MSDFQVEQAVREIQRHELSEEVATRLCPSVFLVTAGDYSDYSVVGVFLGRDRAYRFAERYRKEISDYSINVDKRCLRRDGSLDPGSYYYRFAVSADGRPDELKPHIGFDIDDQMAPMRPHLNATVGSQFGTLVWFIGKGKTEEHARRSAEQLHREWQAAGFTVDTYLRHQRSGGKWPSEDTA